MSTSRPRSASASGKKSADISGGSAPAAPRLAATLVLENIGELLTLEPGKGDTGSSEPLLGSLKHAAVAMEGERIVWVGPMSDLSQAVALTDDVERMDVGGRLVTPGLIDAHTHLVFAGGREPEFEMRVKGATYQEIAAAGGGIARTMRATRDASFDDLLDTSLKHLGSMLSQGVTTVEIKSGYGLDVASELKLLEVIQTLGLSQPLSVVPTFLGAHVIPLEHRPHRERYIDMILQEMLPEVQARGLAEFCDIFVEQGAYTIEEARRILTAAAARGLKLKVHAEQLSHTGAARLATELGAVSAEHLEYVNADDLKAMRDAGTVAVLLPGAAFFLGQEFPDARRFLDAGVTVAVATDFNPGSSPTANLTLVGTMAAVRMHMPPAQVLHALTVGAAAALSRSDEIGRIVPGMQGDLAIFDVQDYRTLFYRFGANHCVSVIKAGEVVYP